MAPRLPQRPITQALSLEQEISVLQQFGHSDQDILELPADLRTLAANGAMALGVLPHPAWPNFWSLFRWRAGWMAPRLLALFRDEFTIVIWATGMTKRCLDSELHKLRLRSRRSTGIMYFSGLLLSGIGLALLWLT